MVLTVSPKNVKELSDTKATNSRVQWFPIRQLLKLKIEYHKHLY